MPQPTIARESCNTLSVADFYAKYMLPNRPVLIDISALTALWRVRTEWTKDGGGGGGSGEQQQQQQVVPLPGGVYHLLMLPHYFLLGSITQKWRAGWTDRDSAPVVPDCEISLGWFVCRYGVDLRSMRQIKLADPSRTRQVQRQVCTPKRFQLQCVPTSFLTRAGCIIRLR
jgi:hypothetical protein